MQAPSPIVRRRVRDAIRLRVGRGFSVNEIREAGLTPKDARKLGLYVDSRRKSMRVENVEMLKRYLSTIGGSPKGEKRSE